jgi:hypothetical protein
MPFGQMIFDPETRNRNFIFFLPFFEKKWNLHNHFIREHTPLHFHQKSIPLEPRLFTEKTFDRLAFGRPLDCRTINRVTSGSVKHRVGKTSLDHRSLAKMSVDQMTVGQMIFYQKTLNHFPLWSQCHKPFFQSHRCLEPISWSVCP